MNQETNKLLLGQSLSPGLAMGKVWLYEGRLPDKPRDQAIHESEVQRQQTNRPGDYASPPELGKPAEQAEHQLNRSSPGSFRRTRRSWKPPPF